MGRRCWSTLWEQRYQQIRPVTITTEWVFRSYFPCQAMTHCSPSLGNESLTAAVLGKYRENIQSKQYTEPFPSPRERAGENHRNRAVFFLQDSYMEHGKLLNSTFSSTGGSFCLGTLHQLGDPYYSAPNLMQLQHAAESPPHFTASC